MLAYNPKTHKMELEPVLHVWLNHDHDLVDLTLTTTTHAPHSTVVTKTSEVIHTNQKHPFFTLEHGFVPVGQLHLGMHVLRADGNIGVVTGWKVVSGTKVMYNLTVAQDHTFTVGVGQWVVHNTAGGSCGGDDSVDLPGNLIPDKQVLSDSGNTSVDNGNGLTRAGQAFQKHADRAGGGTLWGPTKGGTTALNERGQTILDQIINGDDTTWSITYKGSRYAQYGGGGWVLDGVLPDGRGARWSPDGTTFIGFLNP